MKVDIFGKGILVDYIARMNSPGLPTQLIFFVTSRCNYQCPGCFYWDKLNLKQGELSLVEIQKISSSLNALSRLLISGGEPFLRDDLADICHIFYKQNHIKGIDLPTNGSLTQTVVLTTESILKKCPNAKVAIGISIDGPEETHDSLRQKKGSFQLTIETITALSKLKTHYANLSIHIISVVSNKNIGEIVPLIKFITQNFDIDSFGPNPIRGNPKDASLIPPTAEQWLKLTNKLSFFYKYLLTKKYKSFLKRHIIYAQRRYLDKITCRVLEGNLLPFSCKAGDTIAVLEPNSEVRICELTNPIGYLRDEDYDFKKVWFSQRAASMREQIKECACTHGCFLGPSISLSPHHLLCSILTR